jgi:ABC-type methionine transport system ATPase subunit
MTVFDNVIYPLNIQGVPKSEASSRTGQAVAQVNLKGLDRRFPYQLSGGQQ